MEALRRVEGVVAPLDRDDVDTDQIIPKQFLKRTERTGYGEVLFHDWRYRSDGTPEPGFVLNREPWNRAKILVGGRNFGCGSSREHAAWALFDFGIRAVVAPSFADIFLSNCFQTGIAPVALPEAAVRALVERSRAGAYSAVVDLETLELRGEDGLAFAFEMDPFRRRCLMEGTDDIGLTLRHEEDIAAYERERAGAPSWA